MLRGGRVGGLLQQGSSSPPPPAAAAVPVFEVAAYDVEDGTCWYSTSVVPHPGANRLEVAVRWSEMEAIVKELRALYPAMHAVDILRCDLRALTELHQTRPDQTRPDQTRAEYSTRVV